MKTLYFVPENLNDANPNFFIVQPYYDQLSLFRRI